ncbi:MAG: protein kinase [Planctomycetota bacterium]
MICPNTDESDSLNGMDHLDERQQETLGVLLDQYLQAMEEGVPPSVASITRNHPDLQPVLQECVDGLACLHRLAGGTATAIPADLVEEEAKSSRTLGEYELHEEIGRGGMGIVYRAIQKSLNRTVAVKVLPLTSTLDPMRLRRFRHEAEAAALLHHPNIIPVYSVGCEAETHFYVMQFIDGQSLDKIEDLSWRDATEYAIQAAEGIHAAHKLGIIHRDIKPSNLIANRSGRVLVGDFGLARFQKDSSLTRSGEVLGTLQYMSPEQARGDAAVVDGRTDVYSLGATLYEWLTGKPPFADTDSLSLPIALEHATPAPIDRTRPGLPSDLNTVVQKALSKRREDRYETAEAFAEDLGRVLRGEPTHARPPSPVDRGMRFLAKHRRFVAFGVVACLFSVVGLAVFSAILAEKTRLAVHHADRAEKNEAIAREAVDRLGGQISEMLRDVPAATSVRRHLLRETLAYYEALTQDSRELKDLADVHSKIGELHAQLGANDLAVAAYLDAEKTYHRMAEATPEDPESRLAWSMSQNNVAQQYAASGQSKRALGWFKRAIELQTGLETEIGAPASAELAVTLNNLGKLLTNSGHKTQAKEAFQQSLERVSTSAEDSTSETVTLEATIQGNLAWLSVSDAPAMAESLSRQSSSVLLSQLAESPENVEIRRRAVSTLNTQAQALANLTRHREAVETLRRSIELSLEQHQRFPECIEHWRDLSLSFNQLGMSLQALQKTSRAIEAFSKAAEFATNLNQAFPSDAGIHALVGSVLHNLSVLHEQAGNVGKAQAFSRRAKQHQVASRDAATASTTQRVGGRG